MSDLVFVDSVYWIAAINLRDQWRERALQASNKLVSVSLVTTDDILIETLNYFAERSSYYRKIVCSNIQQILLNPEIQIVDATHDQFLTAFELYSSRLDKGYSLTDCISMNICRERGITDILTHDDHFRQ